MISFQTVALEERTKTVENGQDIGGGDKYRWHRLFFLLYLFEGNLRCWGQNPSGAASAASLYEAVSLRCKNILHS